MALYKIPTDPQPSAKEIDIELSRLVAGGVSGDSSALHLLAVVSWKWAKRKVDPDAFLVPFVENPDAYNEYRRSSTWKHIRKAVLNAAQHECSGCSSRATQVHHRDYRPSVLSGEDTRPLIALCKSCHEQVHKSADGRPRNSWQEQEAALAALVAKKETSSGAGSKSFAPIPEGARVRRPAAPAPRAAPRGTRGRPRSNKTEP